MASLSILFNIIGILLAVVFYYPAYSFLKKREPQGENGIKAIYAALISGSIGGIFRGVGAVFAGGAFWLILPIALMIIPAFGLIWYLRGKKIMSGLAIGFLLYFPFGIVLTVVAMALK